MSWNYRVLAHQVEKEVYFQIHEVYYAEDNDNTPQSYSTDPSNVGGEDLEEVVMTVEKFSRACAKPILWAGKKWPQKYKQQ